MIWKSHCTYTTYKCYLCEHDRKLQNSADIVTKVLIFDTSTWFCENDRQIIFNDKIC